MKVEQFNSKNQFHLYGDGIHELQSYESLVVKIQNGIIITLGRDWNYKKTTPKYVYLFLEKYANINFYGISNKRDYVRKMIEKGEINYDENMY